MKTQVNIRPYTEKDQEQVISLLRLNTPLFFAPEEEKDLLHYLQQEREAYFVLENETGEIAGCSGINFSDNGTTGKISWDILHPDYQGMSLGTQLLQYRISLMKGNKDIKKIIVRTSQLAYRFYEKNGFALKEKTEDYWAKGFHLYLMELEKTLW